MEIILLIILITSSLDSPLVYIADTNAESSTSLSLFSTVSPIMPGISFLDKGYPSNFFFINEQNLEGC